MGGEASYATLGLEPGADSAAVERAYKRLIKLHHPDREGGDAARAAEINRAYRDLKAASAYRDPLELNRTVEVDRRRGGAWVLTALVIAAAAGSLFMGDGPLGPLADLARRNASKVTPFGHGKAAATNQEPMDEPLQLGAIDAAIHQARSIASDQDEIALARASRDCQRELRNAPTIAGLDRCAAFDDAVVQLQDRDPLRDRGPFSELAVTGRLWSAASALSDDYLAIDGRLDRIRLRVELTLAPSLEPAGPTQPKRQPRRTVARTR